MTRWYYTGYVSCGDGDYTEIWHGETKAENKKRAITNLKHQYRKSHGKIINMKLRIDENNVLPFESDIKQETVVVGPKSFKKEDFKPSEWEFLCKIFDMEYAESITLEKYMLRTYGIRKEKANGS